MTEIPTAHFDKDHYMNPHNIEYTDTQLKQTLAKMLPDMIRFEFHVFGTPITPALYWRGTDEFVLDTELLHLCWLVEETLDCPNAYMDLLGEYEFHATWQQRTLALAKVKGVEIV